MDVALNQLPIPDWGLVCPQCSYPLKGLPSHRCPECGTQFDIAELIRPWTRLRDPRFTGRELPVPDYGLTCGACGRPLAGAESFVCPACQTPFDLQALRPAQAWFVLDSRLCGDLPMPGVQALLGAENVPYIPVKERSVREIYAGTGMTFTRLRVASEFYFEVLWLLRKARLEMEAARTVGKRARWHCKHCGRVNPGNFEICWNCQQARNAD